MVVDALHRPKQAPNPSYEAMNKVKVRPNTRDKNPMFVVR
jgi:hypothetical protein